MGRKVSHEKQQRQYLRGYALFLFAHKSLHLPVKTTIENWKSSRGGVNRRHLKIINFEHTLHLGLGLEINLECGRSFHLLWVAQSMRITLGANSNQYEQGNFRERREEKQIEWRSTRVNTMICFLMFGSKEPSPRWGGHKGWIYSNPFPLSIGHLDRLSASS
jgi:hypothetical protein